MTTSLRRSPDDIRQFEAPSTLAQNLQEVLVDLIELHLQGKQAHWNLIGTNFRDLHLQIDEIVDIAAVRETRLRLPFTDLLISLGAPLTSPAATDERCGDTFTATPSTDVVPNPDHDPGPFMTRNLRRKDIGVMVLPPMPVAAAHSRGPDPDDRAVRRQNWFWRVNHA
jgi:hypothetical protein